MSELAPSPVIDVVVVAYRSEEDLPSLLKDLGTMTLNPWKLHLFDNLGNPKTLTRAWNDLAHAGTAPYIAFLNTDIRISPDWDVHLMNILNRQAGAGIAMPEPVGHDWAVLSGRSKTDFPRNRPCPPPPREAMIEIAKKRVLEEDLYDYSGTCDAPFYSVLMKRELWANLKGFDERLRFYGQDHDFQRRAKQQYGVSTFRVRKVPFWHKCGGSTEKAMQKGDVNINSEMVHCGEVSRKLKDGELVLWHNLTDEQRMGVRQDRVYARMPR